jgi:hypothetical protein
MIATFRDVPHPQLEYAPESTPPLAISAIDAYRLIVAVERRYQLECAQAGGEHAAEDGRIMIESKALNRPPNRLRPLVCTASLLLITCRCRIE